MTGLQLFATFGLPVIAVTAAFAALIAARRSAGRIQQAEHEAAETERRRAAGA